MKSFKMYITETQTKNKLNTSIKHINDHFNSVVVKYYNDTRNPTAIPSITGKIEGGVDGITNIMKTIFGAQTKVESLSGPIARSISGTYDSYEVKISPINSFYFRSIIGEKGALSKKDLTPVKLKLNGKILTKVNVNSLIEEGLKNNSDLPLEVLELCRNLINLAKNKGEKIVVTPNISKLLKTISKADLKKIGTNYGEIVLAIWCLYNKPNAESIFFPKEENNPLADFIVNFSTTSKIPPLNVSAKYEAGANASLNSIIPPDSKPPESATRDEVKAFNAIMSVAYDKIIDGLLNAEKILETPEYVVLQKMINGNVTLDSISKLVENALNAAEINSKEIPSLAQYNKFLATLDRFYKLIPGKSHGKPNISSMRSIAALGTGKYHHPIYYAFSVSLADKFNNDDTFSDVLNKAANAIKAEQIYLDITNDNIKINMKHFSESKFLFAAGAYAYKADNVRMKVKMIK